MAITAYTGLPGSGKSYSVAEYVVIPALEQGREVYTNIPFDAELCNADFNKSVHQFDIADIDSNPNWFQDLPKGVIIIIDECWRVWPSGMKANAILSGHKEFFAEHRHLVGESGHSTEIILATQDLSQLASFVRNLVDKTFRSIKLDAVGQDNRFRIDIYQGAVTGQNPPERLRLDQRYGKYKKTIYKYYKSQTKSDINSIGSEKRSDDRFNVLKGNWVKYYAAFIIVGLVAVFYGSKQVFNYFSNSDSQAESSISAPVDSLQAKNTNAEPSLPLPPPKPKKPDLFDGREAYISGNLGQWPFIDYTVTVQSGDDVFDLKMKDLNFLNYHVQAINQCLMFITVNDARYTLTCRKEKSRREFMQFNLDSTPKQDA